MNVEITSAVSSTAPPRTRRVRGGSSQVSGPVAIGPCALLRPADIGGGLHIDLKAGEVAFVLEYGCAYSFTLWLIGNSTSVVKRLESEQPDSVARARRGFGLDCPPSYSHNDLNSGAPCAPEPHPLWRDIEREEMRLANKSALERALYEHPTASIFRR